MTFNTLAKTTAAAAIAVASFAPLAHAQVGFVPELEADYDTVVSAPTQSARIDSGSTETDVFPQNRGDQANTQLATSNDGLFNLGIFSIRNIF